MVAFHYNSSGVFTTMPFNNFVKTLIFFGLSTAILLFTSAYSFGAYTGTVVDQLTGDPVEGASVLYYWTRNSPQLKGDYIVEMEVHLVYTDKEGRYEIPEVPIDFYQSGFLESENLLIYEPGYQVYMAGVGEDRAGREEDFSFRKAGHLVKLKRIPPFFSHRKHVEEIENALWNIKEYPYDMTQSEESMTWEERLKKKLIGEVEKREFLRRLKWEEERGREEERRDP
jgi:hypothetical protein